METFWNIAMIFFALSGFVGWAFLIFVGVFFWMCQRPPEEKL
jgi:hypothetical protein